MSGGDTDFSVNNVRILADPLINFVDTGSVQLCEGFNISVMFSIYKLSDAGQCTVLHEVWLPREGYVAIHY
ncbi:hypothetical protein D9980_06725 [Serratia sp. 3ACOL1]|jgi:hypothetical protein|nr:hypothetical protein D9980_06725 [Serratia sp. 3ACOL1]